jgi:hypothetical protein
VSSVCVCVCVCVCGKESGVYTPGGGWHASCRPLPDPQSEPGDGTCNPTLGSIRTPLGTSEAPVCVCVCVCDTYTQTHTDTHRHTQTHTDTHRHTQTHTDTHTYTQVSHTHIHTHTHTRNTCSARACLCLPVLGSLMSCSAVMNSPTHTLQYSVGLSPLK